MKKTSRFSVEKYEGLELSDEFARLATESPETILGIVNGVGSTIGWMGNATYHLIPNTIWLLDITAASDIHDVDYVYPQTFTSEGEAIQHKVAADLRFKRNVEILIDRHSANAVMRYLRRCRLLKYHWILENISDGIFLEGKTITGNPPEA